MTQTMPWVRAIAMSVVVGALGWAVLWLSTTPRAGWDSLVYHKYALEYAGLGPEEQDTLSWGLFVRYASPTLVTFVTDALDGEEWQFDLAPSQSRWGLQYRMRPAYPALVAAAFPVLGTKAPLAVSAFATMLFFGTAFAGMLRLAGWRVAVIATGLGFLNLYLTQWLVTLMPDGLAIALWAVTLTTGALWVRQERPIWLLALGLAVLALCLTRPLGILAPAVFGLSAIGAVLLRARVWRAFTAATVAAAVPVAAIVVLFAAAAYPGWWDLLQDLPTLHFSLPDIEDPIGWLIAQDLHALTNVMPIGLLARPLVLALTVGGVVGLLLPRQWWTAPFLAALPVVLVSYLVHPSTTEIDRTLAPAWISLHTGLAILIVLGAVRWRFRLLEWIDRFTRPDAEGAGP